MSTPRVLLKEIDGKTYEPTERLLIDVPEECMGSVMEKMGARKAELIQMQPQGFPECGLSTSFLSCGLFGYRSEFLTDTRGEGILNAVFNDYQPYKGDITRRVTGSLISFETGDAVTYGLYNARSAAPVYRGWNAGI